MKYHLSKTPGVVVGLFFFFFAGAQPNIIYIMTDDMGYGDLSGYGRKDYQTPHLDRLATQGVRLVNAYAAAPLCTPTRTAFMTGRYPARTPVGLMEPLTASKRDSAYGLTADFPSVAYLLQQRGYTTALIGKWHLGFRPENSPVKNGFDYFFGFHSGAADYVSHKGGTRKNDLYENEKNIQAEGYLTDLFTEKAISFVNQKHDQPFFLSLNYNAPHWPWQGPDDAAYPDSLAFTRGGSAATYAAMMKSLDDGIGQLMTALEESGLSENTVVIFTNDNGGEKYSDHGGLTGAKPQLWEGGIRVPAFVRWPGKIKAGTTIQQAAITMDWTATILALAGAKASTTSPLDGIDLMPILMGKKKGTERTFYWRVSQRNQQKAIREGDWKYLQDEKGEYLFNLVNDPGEKYDLKGSNTKVFGRLKAKYAKWEKTVLTPIAL